MSDLDTLNDIYRETMLESRSNQFVHQVNGALLDGIFKVLVLFVKIYIGRGK